MNQSSGIQELPIHAPTQAAESQHFHHKSFWLWVMCLTGVDYFSTLGYQPSIAFDATGLLTPFATIILVLVTLFGAYPVYARVAARSPHGQGSIAMLEKLLHGWGGKILVLVLLGFAATDFVITKTLSAADAAVHVLENPLFPAEWNTSRTQMVATIILLVLLGAMFLRGFREVIGLAVGIVGFYLLLNAIVIGSCLFYLAIHPSALQDWWRTILRGHEHWQFAHNPLQSWGEALVASLGSQWWYIVAVCLVLFPKLALGLSGFETGVAVMPLVKGDAHDQPAHPHGRIRNTRKLLLTAALIMSGFLLTSSLSITTLIAPAELRKVEGHDHQPTQHKEEGQAGEMKKNGKAAGRALAYLAHGEPLVIPGKTARDINPLFGEVFGTIYDISTIVILWFAGASAMAGLLNLVPQYLPRYGMAPEWARAIRPLVILFTLINLFVTWEFNAEVEAQGAAYATGVLVLMSSACVASLIDSWRGSQRRWWFLKISWPFAFITAVFFYTTFLNVVEKPDGIKIASWFILAILLSSFLSRLARSKELRFIGFEFKDEHSRFLWASMKHLEMPVLVPHRPGHRSLLDKEAIIRREHRLGPEETIVYIEAHLGDASEFYLTPFMEIIQEEGRFIVRVTRCASIAHVIAAVALELSKVGRPPEIHFGWSDENPLAANLNFLLFGEGNVPWIVRELIRRAQTDPERQPRVVIG